MNTEEKMAVQHQLEPNEALKVMIKKFVGYFFKEMYRIYTVAIVVLSPYLIQVFETLRDTGEWTLDWRVALAISAIAILKSGDRALHESGLVERGILRY